MKIHAITNFKTFFRKYIYQKCTPAASGNNVLNSVTKLERTPLSDTFEKQNYSQIISEIKNNPKKIKFAKYFLKTTAVNKETYDKLSPQKINAIRAQLSPKLIKDAECLVNITKIMKNLFDKMYGQNQYTFVSIGRSLSAIANCMEYLGVKTKQIPLSGCSESCRDINTTVNIMLKQEAFKNYKMYLDETLKPEKNKQYIFCDFISSGKTLKVFETLLKHPKVNLASEKDKFVGINPKFFYINITNPLIEYKTNVSDFEIKLIKQAFDTYSEVNYLHYTELNDLYMSLEPCDLKQNKMLKFCMLDILKTSKSLGNTN